ncbi:MAG: cache domain-containing protein [Candidatus Devosia symbiotica]|nr:cache domain-containing protein [Candidatus Devosia symbiotica]
MSKSADFGTNFTADGPFADSPLGKVIQDALAMEGTIDIVVSDFAIYAAANNQPASFFAKPLFNPASRKLGVLALQLPSKRIYDVVGDREGNDALMSKFASPVLDAALAGTRSRGETYSYRGTDMLVAAAPIATRDQPWAAVTVMATDEVLAPVTHMRAI